MAPKAKEKDAPPPVSEEEESIPLDSFPWNSRLVLLKHSENYDPTSLKSFIQEHERSDYRVLDVGVLVAELSKNPAVDPEIVQKLKENPQDVEVVGEAIKLQLLRDRDDDRKEMRHQLFVEQEKAKETNGGEEPQPEDKPLLEGNTHATNPLVRSDTLPSFGTLATHHRPEEGLEESVVPPAPQLGHTYIIFASDMDTLCSVDDLARFSSLMEEHNIGWEVIGNQHLFGADALYWLFQSPSVEPANPKKGGGKERAGTASTKESGDVDPPSPPYFTPALLALSQVVESCEPSHSMGAVSLRVVDVEGKEVEGVIGDLLSAITVDREAKEGYLEWKKGCRTFELPPCDPENDQLWRQYDSLASAIPEERQSVPYILHCMVETVLRGEFDSSVQDEEVSDLLDQLIGNDIVSLPKNASKPTVVPHTDPLYREPVPSVLPPEISENGSLRMINSQDMIAYRAFAATERQLNEAPFPKVERTLLNLLKLPGLGRYQMPHEASMSAVDMCVNKAELYHFVDFESSKVDRILLLRELEEFVTNEFGPTVHDRHWRFNDRVYEEVLDASQYRQTFFKGLETDPLVRTHYYPLLDKLLVAMYRPVPSCREHEDMFRHVFPSPLSFSKWYYHNTNSTSEASARALAGREQFPLSSDLRELESRSHFFYPADYARAYVIPGKAVWVLKDGHYFGLKKENETSDFVSRFEANFSDGSVAVLMSDPSRGGQIKTINSTSSGLVLQHYTSGEIIQQYRTNSGVRHLRSPAAEETRRIIVGKGNVIKHMRDGSVEILMASGDVSLLTAEGDWVTTNSKGLRCGTKPDGTRYKLPSIGVKLITEADTQSTIMTREDMVIVVKKADGTSVVEHHDGTTMFLDKQKTDGTRDVRVECPEYATVQIRYSLRFRQTETMMPDGTRVEHDVNVANNDLITNKPDGTTIKFSGETLADIAEKEMRAEMRTAALARREQRKVEREVRAARKEERKNEREQGTHKSGGTSNNEFSEMTGTVDALSDGDSDLSDLEEEPTSGPKEGKVTYEPGANHPLGRRKNYDEIRKNYFFNMATGEASTLDAEGSLFSLKMDGPSTVELSDLDTFKDYDCSRGPRLFLVSENGEAIEFMSQKDPVADEILRWSKKDSVSIVEEPSPLDGSVYQTFMWRSRGPGAGLILSNPDDYFPRSLTHVPRTLDGTDDVTLIRFRQLLTHPVVSSVEDDKVEKAMRDLIQWRDDVISHSDSLVVSDPRSAAVVEAEKQVVEKIRRARAESKADDSGKEPLTPMKFGGSKLFSSQSRPSLRSLKSRKNM